ncbi:MAG: hypothetical protein Q8S19_08315, partial [Bacillota bacterium]|nr:hypothetical protein [Bacillota bacterium]
FSISSILVGNDKVMVLGWTVLVYLLLVMTTTLAVLVAKGVKKSLFLTQYGITCVVAAAIGVAAGVALTHLVTIRLLEWDHSNASSGIIVGVLVFLALGTYSRLAWKAQRLVAWGSTVRPK